MNILHITCSPRGPASESTQLAQAIVDRLMVRHRAARVTRRDLGAAPGGDIDGAYAAALGGAQAPSEQALRTGSLGLSEQLILELEWADQVVIGTPMHNFTLPSSLKAWIDHVVRIRRTFQATPQGKVGMLRDRPVLVAVASGGVYGGEAGGDASRSASRQPDFLTPYLRAILATIGLHDLHFFSVQGTAYGLEAAAAARRQAALALDAYFDQATAPLTATDSVTS